MVRRKRFNKDELPVENFRQVPVEKVTETMTENKLFGFYLDAWNYCRQHNIDLSRIRKVDWKTWEVFV